MGLGYTNQGCLHRLGPRLREARLLASFGDWVMRTKAAGVVLGWVTRNEATGVVWWLGYAKRRFLLRLRAVLCETKVLTSFEGCIMRNKGVDFVEGCVMRNNGVYFV